MPAEIYTEIGAKGSRFCRQALTHQPTLRFRHMAAQESIRYQLPRVFCCAGSLTLAQVTISASDLHDHAATSICISRLLLMREPGNCQRYRLSSFCYSSYTYFSFRYVIARLILRLMPFCAGRFGSGIS